MDYEISYEYDECGFSGSVLAINLRGHGHTPDDIDIFLDRMFWYEQEIEEEGEWEVRETYLRKVPHPEGGSMHIYGGPGRGARAVTVLERPSGWDYWCLNHPYEPASSGIPASQVIDGEDSVLKRMEELTQQDDPRYDVDNRKGMGSYIYLCRECSTDFHERLGEARKKALARLKEKEIQYAEIQEV